MKFPAAARVVTFVITHDRERAKSFYGDVLGFSLTYEDDFAAVFDLNGIMLRISTVPDHVPTPFTVLGWEVADIAESVRSLRDRGVTFNIYDGFGQDDLGVWTAPGSAAKVAWFKDLDGNVLSLTQFAAA